MSKMTALVSILCEFDQQQLSRLVDALPGRKVMQNDDQN